MSFENLRSRKVGIALTTGIAALALSACEEVTYSNYQVPEGTIDLGPGKVSVGRTSYDARSFLVPSQEAADLICPTQTTTPTNEDNKRELEFDRHIIPADNGKTQIDCYITDWDVSQDEIAEIPIEYK